VSEYSIFLDEETNTLFAFQRVESDGGSQDLGKTEIVKKVVRFYDGCDEG